MKRLLTALTIASSIVFVAMPALAATEPLILSKRQVPVPTFPVSILKQYRAENARPHIIEERVCEMVTYRKWKITEQLSYWEIGDRGRTTKWLPGDSKELAGCAGRSAILAGSQTPRFETYSYYEIAPPESFSRKNRPTVMSTYGYTSLNNNVTEADGIAQRPGFYSRSNARQAADTRPTVLRSNGVIQMYSPPHYKDLSTVDVPSGAELIVKFYRLKDGYGIEETLTSSYRGPTFQCGVNCDPTPEQLRWYAEGYTRYFRIRDGEKAYSEVLNLPIVEYTPFNWSAFYVFQDGVYTYSNQNSFGLRLHKIDPMRYEVNEGTVVQETPTTRTVRYSLVDSGTDRTVQRWEAVIQK